MEQSSKQMIAYVLIELKSFIGTVIVTVEDIRVLGHKNKPIHTFRRLTAR